MWFYLCEGVIFYSGNLMIVVDIDWIFDCIKESFDFKGIFVFFIDVEVVDDYIVDLKIVEFYLLILYIVIYLFVMDSVFYIGIIDDGKDKVEIVKYGDSFVLCNMLGIGLFIVIEWEQGVCVVFDCFDGYWDIVLVGNVDEIILILIKEDLICVVVLLLGDVDFIVLVLLIDLQCVGDVDGVDLIMMLGICIIIF